MIMNQMRFRDYVMEECKRQWEENQEKEYGSWEKQTFDVRGRYYNQMYIDLEDDPILQKEFNLCNADENNQFTQIGVFDISSSFLAMTDNIKHGGGEVIPPTPELIAEYIMTHKEQPVFITNHDYDVLIIANKGKIISCVDDDFLKNELQPAIDDYDNWVKRWQDLQGNLSVSTNEDGEDLEM